MQNNNRIIPSGFQPVFPGSTPAQQPQAVQDAELVHLLDHLDLANATTTAPDVAQAPALRPPPAMPVSLYNIFRYVGGRQLNSLTHRALHDSVHTPDSLAFVLLYLGDQPDWGRRVIFTNEPHHLLPCDTNVVDFRGRSHVILEVESEKRVPVFARVGGARSQRYNAQELCWAPIGMGRIDRVAVFPDGSPLVGRMLAKREERPNVVQGT